MSLDSLDALLDREWIDDSLSSDVRGFYSRRKSKRELVPRVIAVADKIAENDGDLAYDFLSFSLEKMAMARRAASAEVLVETTEKVAEIAPEIAETYVANFGNHINENAFLDTIHYVPRVIGAVVDIVGSDNPQLAEELQGEIAEPIEGNANVVMSAFSELKKRYGIDRAVDIISMKEYDEDTYGFTPFKSNMKNKVMFGFLDALDNSDFLDGHPEMRMITDERISGTFTTLYDSFFIDDLDLMVKFMMLEHGLNVSLGDRSLYALKDRYMRRNFVGKDFDGFVEAYFRRDPSVMLRDDIELIGELNPAQSRTLFFTLGKEKYIELGDILNDDSHLINVFVQEGDFDEYLPLLVHKIKGDYSEWVRQTPENQNIEAMLDSAGINVDTVIDGIGERKVNVKMVQSADQKPGYLTFSAEFGKSVKDLLSDGVHKPENLILKAYAAVGEEGVKPTGDENKDIEKLIEIAEENESNYRKVLNSVIEYGQKKDRQKDKEVVQTSLHHLTGIRKYLKKSSSKVQEGTIEYTFRLAKKDPIDDLNIGNHSGCCIGVYSKESGETMSNGVYMPFYLQDMATQMVEIYQNVPGNGGPKRVGMALMFASQDDLGFPVLMVNSVELSKMNFVDNEAVIGEVCDQVVDYIKDYADASGFKAVAMGTHEYNTAINYGAKTKGMIPPKGSLKKMHAGGEFYSDVFESSVDGIADQENFAYLKR